MYAKKTNKKSALLIVLALVLAIAAIAGTVAWLTDSDTETNTFTIGAMDEPDVGPTDPSEPEVPNVPETTDPYDPEEDGYIHEPYWPKDDPETPENEEGYELAPGGDYAKDPYVGVGADSEAAWIFVEIENNFDNDSVYFELNSGWTAVDGYCDPVDGETDCYTSGVFAYNTAIGGAGAEAWTETPVFSSIHVSDDATYDDLAGAEYDEDAEAAQTTIVINAFIHQAVDGNGETIPQATAQEAALTHFGYTATP